jgi:hypothetical protein
MEQNFLGRKYLHRLMQNVASNGANQVKMFLILHCFYRGDAVCEQGLFADAQHYISNR